MDIKLTCTGAIPLDDFPENQQFLVVSGINSIGPVLLYKCGNVLKNISNFHSIPGTQKFLAWEPINVELYFSPYVTKDPGSLARIYSNRLVGFSRTMQIRKKSTSAKSVTRSLLSAGLRPVPGNFLVHVETFTPQRLTTRLTTMPPRDY